MSDQENKGQVLRLELSADGANKTKVLNEPKPPKSSAELKSFSGLATYCSKFIPNFATKSKALWSLTRQNVHWQWGQIKQQAFDAIKRTVRTDAMRHFDMNAETEQVVDAA